MIQYRISASNPNAHLFTVVCKIEQPEINQLISLPAWIPGSYMIRDFAKNIVQVKATQNNQAVSLTKLDKSTWQCANSTEQTLQIEYQVYAWDLSVRSAHLDSSHAFFNGTSVFIQVHGHESNQHQVIIEASTVEVEGQWRVATGLKQEQVDEHGFGLYSARDYDELVDCPVEISDFAEVHFTVHDIPHRMVIYGQHDADMERIGRDLEKICSHHADMFGELPEMDHYTFLVMTVGSGYGGLEHRNSTSLLCSRSDLPLPHEAGISDGYRSFLALCSHEYFHTWNVKRIKPEVFIPYQLHEESYTRQLWAFEGITSFYDEIALVRCGMIDPESYLEMLSHTITRVLRAPGRFKQSVADSSFDAWTKFYKQDENAPNAIISYYAKGTLIALALDLLIRKHTDGKASLDDLMRKLWQEYGKPHVGVAEGQIEQLAAEIAGSELSEFFNQYLHDTHDLPLAELFAEIGIEYHQRAAEKLADLGGKAAKFKKIPLSLGIRTEERDEGVAISQVFDDGAAQQAGLSAGDLIIAWNGLRVHKDNLSKLRDRHQVGDQITLHAFRRDELKQFRVTLQPAVEDTCYLTLAPSATDAQRQRLQAWLGNA